MSSRFQYSKQFHSFCLAGRHRHRRRLRRVRIDEDDKKHDASHSIFTNLARIRAVKTYRFK